MTMLDPMFFSYNEQATGGTEIMAKYFHKNVASYLTELKKYNCLIIPGKINVDYLELINDPKEIIIWLHNLVDQLGQYIYDLFTNKDFLNKVKYIITVSEFHRQDVITKTGINPDKVIVIYNAITPIKNDIKRFDKVETPELIYTTRVGRGIEIALYALNKLDIDFKLSIFNEANPDIMELSWIDPKVLKDPRFYFYGTTPHRTVLDNVARSHIFIHTSVWHETFCLCLVEALSANCLSIYSNFGSLKEIGGGIGLSYDIDGKTNEEHIEIFQKKILEGVSMIKNKEFDPKDQASIVNEKFSWQAFTDAWIKFSQEVK